MVRIQDGAVFSVSINCDFTLLETHNCLISCHWEYLSEREMQPIEFLPGKYISELQSPKSNSTRTQLQKQSDSERLDQYDPGTKCNVFFFCFLPKLPYKNLTNWYFSGSQDCMSSCQQAQKHAVCCFSNISSHILKLSDNPHHHPRLSADIVCLWPPPWGVLAEDHCFRLEQSVIAGQGTGLHRFPPIAPFVSRCAGRQCRRSTNGPTGMIRSPSSIYMEQQQGDKYKYTWNTNVMVRQKHKIPKERMRQWKAPKNNIDFKIWTIFIIELVMMR